MNKLLIHSKVQTEFKKSVATLYSNLNGDKFLLIFGAFRTSFYNALYLKYGQRHVKSFGVLAVEAVAQRCSVKNVFLENS